jgi:hypothetical protein
METKATPSVPFLGLGARLFCGQLLGNCAASHRSSLLRTGSGPSKEFVIEKFSALLQTLYRVDILHNWVATLAFYAGLHWLDIVSLRAVASETRGRERRCRVVDLRSGDAYYLLNNCR